MTHHRNIAVGVESTSVGETLLHAVQASAPHATGFDAGGEFVVLDGNAPQLFGATPEDLADRWIFSGNRNLVDEVHVDGVQVVAGGRHRDREAIAARYKDALEQLL